jgi:hypothetical protein
VAHRAAWPIILKLLQSKPQLRRPRAHGDRSVQAEYQKLASTAPQRAGARLAIARAMATSLHCNNFVVCPYLDSVSPGDGGLFLVPGSHRSSFNRPRETLRLVGPPCAAAAQRRPRLR